MKKLILMMFALIFLMNLVSSIQYFQTREFSLTDNRTTIVHASVGYSGIDGTADHIKSGNPLEVYVLYNTYIETWNLGAPNNKVDHCNLLVIHNPSLTNTSLIIFNQNFTDDNKNAQVFVNLEKGDSMTSTFRCVFQTQAGRVLLTPADFTIVTPTWECKECQQFEWSKTALTIEKAISINFFVEQNVEFIKDFVFLNFEFWIIVFWIILIIMLLIAVSLIFTGIFWIYLFIKRHTK